LLCIASSAPNLQLFHNDVNKLLSDIDRPINDDELSDADEDDLLVSSTILFFSKFIIFYMSNRLNYMKLLVKLKMKLKTNILKQNKYDQHPMAM